MAAKKNRPQASRNQPAANPAAADTLQISNETIKKSLDPNLQDVLIAQRAYQKQNKSFVNETIALHLYKGQVRSLRGAEDHG